ncbi:MAG: sensor histidine kinase [Gaiellaceae bacterium]
MSRLPIRLRLTLAFAGVMALVLAGVGLFLSQHLAQSLDASLDQGLRARVADVAALVQQSDTGLRDAGPSPVSAGGNFAQVLDARGRIVDETRGAGGRPLLVQPRLSRARAAPLLVGRARRLGVDVRLLAAPVHAQGQRLVVVVGIPLASRDDAVGNLHRELLWAGPPTLLVTSLIAYLLAAGALRPVERMRRRAETISDHRLSERMPVPAARDELARLGRTLNDMLARIETAVANDRRFVADASHELRSPLSLLRAEVELALEQPPNATTLRDALRSIGEEADRLSNLAEDLLLLARLDEKRLPLREEHLPVNDLLTDVASRFARRASESGRAIHIDAAPIEIYGDRLRLEQALANLLQNALRHGDGDVTLAAADSGDTVSFHVTDQGGGFPPAFLPRAFARFTRADEARTGPGTGLGLAVVAEIAAAHGGTAAAANLATGGADVSLCIPHARARVPAASGSISWNGGCGHRPQPPSSCL